MLEEMSNKKAAETIKEHCYFNGLTPVAKEALDYAVQVLLQTSWVPVNEGLPKPQENGDKDFSDWVLITINLGDNDTLTGVAYYCFSEEKWYTKGLVIGEVTAWMPRPKPYKAEMEDKEMEKEIVIKIPEELYETLKNPEILSTMYHASRAADAVRSGIPLPEGHGVLKDADVMLNKLSTNEASELFGSVTCAEIMDFINNEEPIIEACETGRKEK